MPRRNLDSVITGVLIGKARKIYSALPVEQSSRYSVVKEHILKAYELFPEAYRQKFRRGTNKLLLNLLVIKNVCLTDGMLPRMLIETLQSYGNCC